jgi:hypothetical protein
MDRGILSVTLDVVGMECNGKLAVEAVACTLLGAEDTVIDIGKSIVIWKEIDDFYEYHRDIWNSSCLTV